MIYSEIRIKTMSLLLNHDYLTVKEVANLLKLSELTIYKYIRAQKLQAFEFGRHFRIERSDLEKFIKSQKVAFKKVEMEGDASV